MIDLQELIIWNDARIVGLLTDVNMYWNEIILESILLLISYLHFFTFTSYILFRYHPLSMRIKSIIEIHSLYLSQGLLNLNSLSYPFLDNNGIIHSIHYSLRSFHSNTNFIGSNTSVLIYSYIFNEYLSFVDFIFNNNQRIIHVTRSSLIDLSKLILL